jgi:ferrous iron transport protein A
LTPVNANNSHLQQDARMGTLPLLTLDRLEPHRLARVQSVSGEHGGSERALQLADLGFHAGEAVMVLARAWPAHDPLVVRIGASRFALRRAEAALVTVEHAP